MTRIAKTLLATHDPATVLQTDRAIPYVDDNDVPDNATFRLDLPGLKGIWYPLCGAFKVELDWPVTIEGGFGKTCWGARMEVAGEVDDDDPRSAWLTIDKDDFRAGKVVGAELTIDFRLRVWSIHHYGFLGLKHNWHQRADEKVGPFRFDLLTTLYSIVQAAIQLGDIIPFADIIGALLPKNVDTSGYFDEQSGILEKGGALTVTPKVVGDIDLVQLAETCGVDIITLVFLLFPPAEVPVQAATRLGELGLKVLSFVTPTVAFGPSFGFASPVDISITDFTIDETRYEVQGVENTSPPKLYGYADSDQAAPPADPSGRDLTVHFHAAPKDAIYLGLFAQITWLKVLSKEARKIWDVYEEANITAFDDEPVESDFTNVIGAMDLDESDIFSTSG